MTLCSRSHLRHVALRSQVEPRQDDGQRGPLCFSLPGPDHICTTTRSTGQTCRSPPLTLNIQDSLEPNTQVCSTREQTAAGNTLFSYSLAQFYSLWVSLWKIARLVLLVYPEHGAGVAGLQTLFSALTAASSVLSELRQTD